MTKKTPRHIVIIPDGNRRWAVEHEGSPAFCPCRLSTLTFTLLTTTGRTLTTMTLQMLWPGMLRRMSLLEADVL